MGATRQGRVSHSRNEALSNNVLYTKELGGKVSSPATVATGVRADPKGHGPRAWRAGKESGGTSGEARDTGWGDHAPLRPN